MLFIPILHLGLIKACFLTHDTINIIGEHKALHISPPYYCNLGNKNCSKPIFLCIDEKTSLSHDYEE